MVTATRKTATRKSPARPAPTRKAATTPTKTAQHKTAPTPKPNALPTAPVKAVRTASSAPKADKKAKPEKVKVVRDSFTIPKVEYTRIADMKKRALALGKEVKKSELLRAGLALLAATSDVAFTAALANVPTLKTGRPGKV